MNNEDNYDHVFALDFSSQMLGELVNSLRRQSSRLQDIPISVIRGDAGSLPFRDATIDAIHWGAAMHCVPDAEKALEEVYRVLKPGGRLYATTFLRPFPDIIFRFFTVEEMTQLARQAGFGNSVSHSLSSGYLHVEGKGVYGILKAVK
jgi:ubiquinone/menaquinone biosynthesis C-methylase UbiE